MGSPSNVFEGDPSAFTLPAARIDGVIGAPDRDTVDVIEIGIPLPSVSSRNEERGDRLTGAEPGDICRHLARQGFGVAMSPHDLAPLEIRLFGPPQVRVGGTSLPRLRSRKGLWLIALLALRAGRDVERAWLGSTLWPESDETAASANLRNTLADLRRALGDEAGRLSAPTPSAICLDLCGAHVDLLAFDAAIARGDIASLKQAIALYGGPLLEGCAEAWAFEERQVREQAYLTALETLAGRAMAAENPTAAERYLRRAVATGPLRETAQRALMEALAATGNVAAALQVYRDLRHSLHQELRADPDPATTALYRTLRAASEGGDLPGRQGDTEKETAATSRSTVSGSSVSPSHRGRPSPSADSQPDLEPVGGAVPLGSPFYVVRPVDAQLFEAIARQDSIVLVKGARQTGKTSLLARGLQQAREAGAQVVLTDFQMFSADQLEAAEPFLLALAHSLAVELDLDVSPLDVWKTGAGPNLNFDLFLRRHVLAGTQRPMVWGLDGVDRLFGHGFAGDLFSLFRSWHDRRHLTPLSAWSRLTLAMAYATEAHLFITDLNQSPFNVGTRLSLEDFTAEQVADLNRRYHSPLRDEREQKRFYGLVSGHPYLVRRGLYEISRLGLDMDALEAEADQDHGIFGDHLRRLMSALLRDADLCAAVTTVLQGRGCPTPESFYRLRAAGVLIGGTALSATLRCRLYQSYLAGHLQ
jgi:DNA-binding SARP family transcriptional activator